MVDSPALAEFKYGISVLRRGRPAWSPENLRHASEFEQQDRYYDSIPGLSVRHGQRKCAAVADICKAALILSHIEVQFHLILAEVCEATGLTIEQRGAPSGLAGVGHGGGGVAATWRDLIRWFHAPIGRGGFGPCDTDVRRFQALRRLSRRKTLAA
jgi:hypothetical protein